MDTKDILYKISNLSEDKKVDAQKMHKKLINKAAEYTKKIVDDKINNRLGEC